MSKDLKTYDVLLVEDSPSLGKIIEGMLNEIPDRVYDLEICHTLTAAKILLSLQKPDLIILDLNLIDSKGLATFKELIKKFKHFPYIILTSINNEELAIQALNLGAQDYLIKNKINQALLANSIKYSLERHKFSMEKKRLSSIASQTDNSIAILDRNGRIEWVNEAFTKLTGYELKEIQGTRGEILRKSNPAWIRDQSLLENCIKENKSEIYEIKNYPKKGKAYWSSVTITPVYDDLTKNFLHFIAVETNITDRIYYERRLKKERLKAERAQKIEEEFIENMSHEIRTPLNAILGFSKILLDNKTLDEQNQEDVRKIYNSSIFLLDIIGEILDFSKISKGKAEIENIFYNLRQLFGEVSDIQKYSVYKQEGVEYITNYQENLPDEIFCDPVKVKQILNNLLSNAFKFTHKGTVTLNVGFEKNTDEEGSLIIEVKDTGIGIEEKKQHLIFEKFKQEDTSTTRNYGGTGLGLSIMKLLVQLMNGSISLDSKKGEGSTFKVEIPCKYQNKTSTQAPSKAKEVALNGVDNKRTTSNIHVLIAEDNEMNQMFMERLFKMWHIPYQIAENGEIAYNELQKNHFDLVLMDVQMPVMDGYEATKKIRSSTKKLGSIPIIALTASSSKKQQKKCMNVGMTDYLTKPIKPDALLSKICNTLNIKNHETRQ